MAAIARNYTIERGIQFVRQITLTSGTSPLDLTGVTIEGKIRLSELPTEIRPATPGTGAVITEFDITVATPATGVFLFGLTIIKSELFVVGAVYDFDIVLTLSNGDRRRILMGQLTIEGITTDA